MSKKDKKKEGGKKSEKKIKSPKKKSSSKSFPKDIDVDSFNLSNDNQLLPSFLKDFVNHIRKNAGIEFETINIHVVGKNELDTLPKELLTQILVKAVNDEQFELASKVRDIIKDKS